MVVDTPADPETALRTRLVKNDVPDVLTVNGNGTFGEFATAKIFKDFSTDPVLKAVNPAFPKVIGNLGRGGPGEVNGVPFAANAIVVPPGQPVSPTYCAPHLGIGQLPGSPAPFA